MEAALLEAEPLPRRFYLQDTTKVARALLGKILVNVRDGVVLAGRIVETEAYLGAKDPASHAYRGETPRNRSMFAEGGTCYVYLSYGMHYCMNVVTAKAGVGEAVLLRAVQPVVNAEAMAELRGLPPHDPKAMRRLADGPGKLTQALGIDIADDGRRFDGPDFKIVAGSERVAGGGIICGPRIGISKAVDLPLRFRI
jgi:DNA-3-methyladenine glycosylase